jgi:UDP-N-acetylmuramoyl-L-alanyl-D-glutamate--2,6-diaminopimelate ligase
MSGSPRPDNGYSLVVIRPARIQARPLSGLGELLGTAARDIPNGTGQLSGVTLDSRQVQPGDLYAALPGERAHGADFSGDAVARGAVAILTDPAGRDRAARHGVPVFVVGSPRERLGDVACWIYGDPSTRMRLIGVTGTSGKTTTSYLAEAGLRAAGHVTGLIGGVELRIGGERFASKLTTPEAPELQALLAVMGERGVTAAAMEVSSHSLALGRVAGTRYDVVVFTNLSQDHLDFHAGFEDYFRAKARLFTPRYASVGVVNVADKYGRRLAAEATVPVTTFCAEPGAGGYWGADWRAQDVRSGSDGSAFRVIGPGGVEADASVTLPGPFNVANALGAIVALVEAGARLEDAVIGVASCAGVPGRLQRVQLPSGGATPRTPRGVPDEEAMIPGTHAASAGATPRTPRGRPREELPDAFVDYSHKPAAVEAVLRALRAVTAGELIIVLGCGGDRDRAKRPLMGAAAASLADVAILTSDNPRSEDPLAILDEMLHGVVGVPPQERGRVIIEPDRAAAIGLAVGMAGKGDVVLVAGKGHETGQYVGGAVLPFDDAVVTAQALASHQDGDLT